MDFRNIFVSSLNGFFDFCLNYDGFFCKGFFKIALKLNRILQGNIEKWIFEQEKSDGGLCF